MSRICNPNKGALFNPVQGENRLGESDQIIVFGQLVGDICMALQKTLRYRLSSPAVKIPACDHNMDKKGLLQMTHPV
jgi:hypothetical protein